MPEYVAFQNYWHPELHHALHILEATSGHYNPYHPIHRHRWAVSMFQCLIVWIIFSITIIAMYILDRTSALSPPMAPAVSIGSSSRVAPVSAAVPNASANRWETVKQTINGSTMLESSIEKIALADRSTTGGSQTVSHHENMTTLELLHNRSELSHFAQLLLKHGESHWRDRLDDVSQINTLLVPSNRGLTVFWQGKGKYYGDIEIAEFVLYHMLPHHRYSMKKGIKHQLMLSDLPLDELDHQSMPVRVYRSPRLDWIRNQVVGCVPQDMEDPYAGDHLTSEGHQEGGKVHSLSGGMDDPSTPWNHDHRRHHKKKSKKLWFLNFCSKVTQSYHTKNGIIHQLSFPLALPETIESLVMTRMHQFSMAAQAFLLSGSNQVLAKHRGLTVFVPRNEAFQKLPATVVTYLFSTVGRRLLLEIMQYHISSTLLYSNQLVNTQCQTLETLSFGRPLTVELSTGKKKSTGRDTGSDENSPQYPTVGKGEINDSKRHRKEKTVVVINGRVKVDLIDWPALNGNVMILDEVLTPQELDLYDPKFPLKWDK